MVSTKLINQCVRIFGLKFGYLTNSHLLNAETETCNSKLLFIILIEKNSVKLKKNIRRKHILKFFMVRNLENKFLHL